MLKHRRATDWLMLIALVVFWGSSFVLTKLAVDSLSPLWVMALRLVIGAAALYGFLRYKGMGLRVDRETLPWFLWISW